MTTSRVRYLEGQVLHAVDLMTEQADRRERRRLHNNAQHGWGIVHGLKLRLMDSGVAVAAGMAIDGYGRELVAPNEWVFSVDDLAAVSEECVSLWLIGCSVPEPVRGHGDQDCDPGRFAGLREAAAVLLDVCAPELIPEPVELAPQERPHPPYLPAPGEGGWPVFLGAVKVENGSWSLASAERRRPYVSLNGWRVETPRGDVRLQIGNEVATDRNRFAVATAGDTDATADHLTVDLTGRTTVHGDLALIDGEHASNLVVDAGHQSGTPRPLGITLSPPVETPKEALPWRVYRTTVKENEQQIDELRIEILDPGKNGDPARDLFAIGHHDGATFVPCLTVRADCGVTISGDLAVDGEIVQAPIPDDPRDPRFDEALAEALAEGTSLGMLLLTPSDPDSFDLAVTDVQPLANGNLSYEITVTNATAEPVSPVVAYSTVTVGGVTLDPKPIGVVARLDGVGSRTNSTTFMDTVVRTSATESVAISVTAAGVGSGPVIAYGTIERPIWP